MRPLRRIALVAAAAPAFVAYTPLGAPARARPPSEDGHAHTIGALGINDVHGRERMVQNPLTWLVTAPVGQQPASRTAASVLRTGSGAEPGHSL